MIERHIPLQQMNSYLIESEADYYYRYETDRELADIVAWAKKSGMTIKILGGGTNVLFVSPQIRGLVIHLTAFGYTVDDDTITVGSGVDSSLVALAARYNSLTGAEFLYALPGTIGGAVYMNARAFDRSISDTIVSARIMDLNGIIRDIEARDMAFSYKDSVFQHEPLIILSARFKLSHDSKENIDKKMTENIEGRRSRGHFDYPSCGSVFKNPYDVGIPAGKLIEAAGLKGTHINDAQIYDKHANFIVNRGNASGRDIAALIEKIQACVKEKQNVLLQPEVCFWE